MTWALVGIGVLALGFTLVMVFRLTVTVSRTSSNALASLITFDQLAHEEREAHREQVMGLIDRFLSGDWEAVRLHEGTRDTPWGGFLDPREQAEEERDVVSQIPRPGEEPEDDEEPYVEQVTGRWGSADRAQERADALDDAAALAEEDDLDSMDADRQRRLEQARERDLIP